MLNAVDEWLSETKLYNMRSYMLDLILSIQSVCLPISCGNSSQAIATDMDMPVVTFSENAAPIDIPSIMLCRLSPNRTNRANVEIGLLSSYRDEFIYLHNNIILFYTKEIVRIQSSRIRE